MRPLLQLIPGWHRPTLIHTTASEVHLHKRWRLGPNVHANAAHFMRMKGGIEEPFELYGPRTLITAPGGCYDTANLGGQGIHIHHEVNIEHELQNGDDISQRDLTTPT